MSKLPLHACSMQAIAVGNAPGKFDTVRHHRCLTVCWRAGWLRRPRMSAQRSTWLPIVINQIGYSFLLKQTLFLLFLFCRCKCFESFSFDLNESFMLQWATLNSDSNRLTHPNSIVLRHVLAMWPCCDMKCIWGTLLRMSLMELKKISHLSSHAAV